MTELRDLVAQAANFEKSYFEAPHETIHDALQGISEIASQIVEREPYIASVGQVADKLNSPRLKNHFFTALSKELETRAPGSNLRLRDYVRDRAPS